MAVLLVAVAASLEEAAERLGELVLGDPTIDIDDWKASQPGHGFDHEYSRLSIEPSIGFKCLKRADPPLRGGGSSPAPHSPLI